MVHVEKHRLNAPARHRKLGQTLISSWNTIKLNAAVTVLAMFLPIPLFCRAVPVQSGIS